MLSTLVLALSAAPVWTRLTTAISPGATLYPRGAAVCDGRVVVVAEDGIWVSTDGAKWARNASPAEMPGDPPMGNVVGMGDRIWVLGTREAVSGRPDRAAWQSEDGIRWTRLSTEIPISAGLRFADGERLWLFGDQGQSWRSKDGNTWVDMPKSGWRDLVGMGSLGSVLYGFGANGHIWKTDPGAKWVKAGEAGPWKDRWRPSFAGAMGRLWMIGGSDCRDFAVSQDGVKWDRFPVPADWFPRAGVQLVPWRSGLLVLGGKSGHSENSNPQDVWFVHLP